MPDKPITSTDNQKQHLCGMFRNAQSQVQAAAAFLAEGLDKGEKCLVTGSANSMTQIASQMEDNSPQIRQRIAAKQIEFLSLQQSYLSEGKFSTDRMLSLLEDIYRQSLSENYPAVRAVGEMSWSAKSSDTWEELFTYEARLNDFLLHKQVSMYCIYDPSLFPSKQLYRVMVTHPVLANDNYFGACPIYTSSKEFLEEQKRSHFDNRDMNRTGKQFIVVEQTSTNKEGPMADRIIDNVKDAILIIGSQGEIRYMNPSGQERYGNQVNRICHESIFKNVNPCPICQLHKLMEGENEKIETEIQDTVGAHLNLVAYRLSEPDNSNSLIVYLRDVTQRKKWEEESAFLDKFSALGYLASGVSHELNNNLTPIIICSQLLCKNDLPEDVRDKAKKIERSAIASRKLVESLTDFSQQIPHKKDFANLNGTIKKTVDLMEYRLTSANIEVLLDLDSNLPSLLVDELKIQQVFSNLITNAYQAMQLTGGKIIISSSQSNGSCRFEIADTGPGIPPEIRSKIFDPFFTTRQVGEGKGLGLSVSYGIIAAHQGRFSFESKPDQGTVFVIELPLASAPQTGLAEQQSDLRSALEQSVSEDLPFHL
jgi:signal transduction histidine kinase